MSANHSLLNFNKCFRISARPAEFTLLQIISDWGYDSVEPFDEPMIEGSELVKTSHITDGHELRLFLNGSDLLGIRRNFISRDYKYEELDLYSEKCAFLRVGV